MDRRRFLSNLFGATAASVIRPSYFFAPPGGWRSRVKIYSSLPEFEADFPINAIEIVNPGTAYAYANLIEETRRQIAVRSQIPIDRLFDQRQTHNEDLIAYYEMVERSMRRS